MHTYIKNISIGIFGVILPVILLAQAYFGLSSLKPTINQEKNHLRTIFSEAKKNLISDNDYLLFSLMYAESSNQKALINKQIMKVSTIQIGFAVMSLGIMFIILGFNDGGAEISSGSVVSNVNFNFKSASTGVVIFTIGAAMATAAGVLKNQYTTVPIPSYFNTESTIKYNQSITAYTQCRKMNEPEFRECFSKFFYEINKGVLK